MRVIRNARRDGKLGPEGRRPTAQQTRMLGSPPKAHQSRVEFDDMLCVLIVEAQGDEPLPAESQWLTLPTCIAKSGSPFRGEPRSTAARMAARSNLSGLAFSPRAVGARRPVRRFLEPR